MTIVGVAAILLNPDRQVLLLQRDNRPDLPFAGYWTLPGGKVEEGESPEEAIRRELREEIELELPLDLWRVYERPGPDGTTVVQHLYVGRTDKPVSELVLREGQDLRYCSERDIAYLPIAYGFYGVLHEYLSQRRVEVPVQSREPLALKRTAQTWWPLAGSWLLMSVEQPAANAIVARLVEPEINLAAWGGIVFPLALIIEAPIIMLLAASTALSRDWDSYRWLRRFMMWAGGILTLLHVLVAFTPLYDIVAVHIIGAPAEIIEPARVGMMIMTPWTWAIAYRRFNQGVLIRFGHSRAVGIGTMVRLGSESLVLTAGYLIGSIPGIVVASSAIAVGVVSEATYTGLRVRPVLREQVREAAPAAAPLDARSFAAFYVPLAMTSLLYLLVQPIGSATLSRMPSPVESLAAWSVVSGLIFILRSLGMAYNEVVVALLEEPEALQQLRRFTVILVGVTAALMLIVTATPLATLWFANISALSAPLATLARQCLWLALPMPTLNVLQSWYQGIIVHSRRTRGITEATILSLVVSNAVLWGGVALGQVTGLYVGLAAFTGSALLQTAWLWFRSRPAVLALQKA